MVLGIFAMASCMGAVGFLLKSYEHTPNSKSASLSVAAIRLLLTAREIFLMASMVLAFLAVAHGCMNVLVLVWTILLVSVDKESPSENAIYWIGTGPTPRHIY